MQYLRMDDLTVPYLRGVNFCQELLTYGTQQIENS